MDIANAIPDRLKLRFNQTFGRSYVPNYRKHIYIEPTSLCNLDCVFCAYGKKTSPKLTVKQDVFEGRAYQAAECGFASIGLTPITGDIFMDKTIFDKFNFLENYEGVLDYHFYTNFILLDNIKIRELSRLRKLSRITISIYGHDQRIV